MVWVSRILAVAAVMVLPGLAGQWLDKRWGTGFLGLVGFALGLVSGIAYLLTMTKLPPHDMPNGRNDSRPDEAPGDKD
ncbi:MAG: AtpZ/AtpI family protein [Pirellulales bacterium]